jgi:SAM-dependent methyltransferase
VVPSLTTALVGDVHELPTEGQFVTALRQALDGHRDAQVLLLGDSITTKQALEAHVNSRAALTVMSAFGVTTKDRFLAAGVPSGMIAAAFSRTAAELFVSSSVDGSSLSTSVALTALTKAHGFDVAIVPMSSTGSHELPVQAHPASGVAHLREVQQVRRRIGPLARSYRQDQTKWSQRSLAFAGQGDQAGSTYAGGQELHALSKSVRFHRWMASMLRPAIGIDVLEVGAGIGTMTRALAETYPNAAILSIEPDPALFALLNERVAGSPVETATLSTHELEHQRQFDSVLYVNVLEHIEDHVGELQRAASLLRPGGHIGIIVPALPRLYGSLDAKTGHFRRYQKQALKQVAEQAGLVVTELHYFDAVGVLPYWASIKVGSMPALSDRTTYLFDNVLVPLSKVAHKVWKQIPIGKNLLMVARKP